MKLLITSVVMLAAAFVAVSQIIRNYRRKNLRDRRTLLSAALMLSEALAVMSDLLASPDNLSLYRLAMEIMPSIIAIWLMSSFMSDSGMARWGVMAFLSVNGLIVLFNVCRILNVCAPLSDEDSLAVLSLLALIMMTILLAGFWTWLRCLKVLMKCGTVWTVVCLMVDTAYLCFAVVGAAMVQSELREAGVLVLGLLVPALGLRIMLDSKFLIWRRHETLIVESMRLSPMTSASDPAHMEEVYKELYGRIVTYFESRKPFLDSDLTINVVVRDMYSNKLYISKAISHYTGRNFCQFVNYYRVMYSMECFRENPEARIHELASMSGFNSVVSYNMAFRLFMGENPSEWCRKERSRMIRKK